MINSYILLFIGLANIIAIFLVYYSLKGVDKQKKIIDTMIGIGVMYILVLIVYTLSSLGIAKTSNSETIKTYMMMAFVPVNVIVLIPFFIHSYIKAQRKEITIKMLTNRSIILLIICFVILIGEFFYFRNFQKHMAILQEQANQTNNTTITNTENTENSTENNLQNSNELTNTQDINETANKESSTVSPEQLISNKTVTNNVTK